MLRLPLTARRQRDALSARLCLVLSFTSVLLTSSTAEWHRIFLDALNPFGDAAVQAIRELILLSTTAGAARCRAFQVDCNNGSCIVTGFKETFDCLIIAVFNYESMGCSTPSYLLFAAGDLSRCVC
jgi:hypothetical protein